MTHSRWPGGRLARVLAAALMLAGTVTAFGVARALAAPAAGCRNWTGAQPLNPGGLSNTFNSVATESACDAWAVGIQFGSGTTATLTEHWSGSAWTVVPSPAPGTVSQLRSVRGTSTTDVWAVGSYFDDAANMNKTLILHWDGRTWTQVTSPNPSSTDNELYGVRAVSGTDAWAVGFSVTGSTDKTMILHWDGTAWTQVASPTPGTGAVLNAVAATSSTDAWAVGASFTASMEKTLTLHWNGTKWAQVSSPNRGTDDELFGVRGTSSTDTWAVGVAVIGGVDQTLALHWNGTTWTRVTTPNLTGDPGDPPVSNDLVGVAGTSASDTWAVGSGGTQTLLLHWDGSAWTIVPSPAPGANSQLFAVAASSASNIWAVGEFSDGTTERTLAVHCC